VPSIGDVQPLHVATWIETLTRDELAPSTVKQRLAAGGISSIGSWSAGRPGQPGGFRARALARRQIRQDAGARPSEARALIDSIDVTTPAGLRDRALIGLMVYSFARSGAAIAMKVEVYTQNRGCGCASVRKAASATKCRATTTSRPTWPRISSWRRCRAIRRAAVRTIGRGTGQLTRTPLPQGNAHAMIRRRAASAGIETKIGNHTFRATGITPISRTVARSRRLRYGDHASTRTHAAL